MLLTKIKFIYCPVMYFDFMKHYTVKTLLFVLSLILSSPVYSGTIIFGLNLEFIDSRFNDEGFDGGTGLHAGYEFKDWHSWHFGGLFEYMHGWRSKADLDFGAAGEMIYDSKSLYATARPLNWPLMFKAGVVDADYSILRDDMTQNIKDVSNIGYAYGISFGFGEENLWIDLIDYKRVKIGSDSFDSYGISLGILFAN